MSRKREVLIDQDEDIVCYEHSIGNFVRVLIGYGTAMPDGSFVAAENQNYENIIIQGDSYNDLMSEKGEKPAGVFRKQDLWSYVDVGRENFLAQRTELKEKIKSDMQQINTNK